MCIAFLIRKLTSSTSLMVVGTTMRVFKLHETTKMGFRSQVQKIIFPFRGSLTNNLFVFVKDQLWFRGIELCFQRLIKERWLTALFSKSSHRPQSLAGNGMFTWVYYTRLWIWAVGFLHLIASVLQFIYNFMLAAAQTLMKKDNHTLGTSNYRKRYKLGKAVWAFGP